MRRRGGWRKGFGERLGRYSTKFKQAISNRDVIWLHAVSVGEVNICVQLIKVLQPRLPNLKLVVSTTPTGPVRGSGATSPCCPVFDIFEI